MTGPPTTTPPTVVHVHNTNYAAGGGAPAVPPPRKSVVVAYLALALGCCVGIHRFYLRQSPWRWTAFFWIACWTVNNVTPSDSLALLIPFFGLPLIDAFLIPGWVCRHNAGREAALARVASDPLPAAKVRS